MAAPAAHKVMLGGCFLVVVVIGELWIFSLDFETRAKFLRGHFVVLVEILLFLISRFLWNNLADLKPVPECSSAASVSSNSNSDAENERETRRTWTPWKMILFAYLVLSHCSYLTNLFFIGKDPHWFAMLSYCSLGSYLQLATAMAIVKVLNACVCLVNWSSGAGFSRRPLISKRKAAMLTILYAICAAFYGLTAAAQVPGVKSVTIPVRGLSPKWDNTRIVQITDVHLGPTVGFSKLSAIVDVINSRKPDLVVMTGDLVDGTVKSLNEAIIPLSWVKSTYGNFFVTGNHEYYTGDVDNWLRKIEEIGFTPLHNSNVKLTPTGGSEEDIICLAGADDLDAKKMMYTGHGFDADLTLKSCDPHHPVILLAHQPHAAKIALDSPYRTDLVLSGHTHGGQFFPLIFVAYFANPFFHGLYAYGDSSHVYVSQGTQYWGIPMRLGSTMEITDITLVPAL